MPDQTMMLALRIVHIVFGLFWAGTAIALAAFVIPAARANGPTGGRLLREIMQRRRLSASLAVAAALTILSGATMYWRIATDMHDAWMRSRPGLVLGFGGLTALIAFALGAGVAAPTARKLEALARNAPRSIPEPEPALAHVGADAATDVAPELPRQPGAPPEITAELERLQLRLARVAYATAVLLVITATCMAIARYL
ncbi:MAG TPA: hypothetical protein VFK04_02360 [Gemmatimonadaceae bacterium]|nr:hypothetical protein [Gemmatimonadaceae bacterium]